jgi:hypothetical protein
MRTATRYVVRPFVRLFILLRVVSMRGVALRRALSADIASRPPGQFAPNLRGARLQSSGDV